MCGTKHIAETGASRATYLRSLIGRPWSNDASCWHLACEVERNLFGRCLPDVVVPTAPTWRWIIEAIDGHPERSRWQEVEPKYPGLITAADGALVLMASVRRPAHIGVWLKSHQAVIHADQGLGVVLEPVPTLRARGWARLRIYEPI